MSGAGEILAQPLCALAFCWRLERRDGVTIGLTSHDRALEIGGLSYAPTPGITPGAVLRGGDGAAELTDVRGVLSAGAISEADLEAGRWDGATLMLHLTEWTAPGVLWLELAWGTLGHFERQGGAYSVSLQGAGALLDAPVAPLTSPTCRVRLGDRDCRIDLRQHQWIVAVGTVEGEAVVCAGLPSGRYAFGQLRWLEGTNTGLSELIVEQTGDGIVLAAAPAFAVTAGTRALLTEGCDKRLATCAGRFANAVNFRGEPYLPGMDLLTRYPGS